MYTADSDIYIYIYIYIPDLPNTHSLRLVLFSSIYCVPFINFDAMWRAIFHSVNLEIPAKHCALLIVLH